MKRWSDAESAWFSSFLGWFCVALGDIEEVVPGDLWSQVGLTVGLLCMLLSGLGFFRARRRRLEALDGD